MIGSAGEIRSGSEKQHSGGDSGALGAAPCQKRPLRASAHSPQTEVTGEK